MNREIYFDCRWNGNFGIARYSRELMNQLDDLDLNLINGEPPLSLRGFHNSFKVGHVNNFYSPSFLPFLKAKIQIITIHDLIHLSGGFSPKRIVRESFYAMLKEVISKREIYVNTVSVHSKSDIVNWLNLDEQFVTIVPNGLSSSFSNKKMLSPVERGLVIGFVGNEKPHKNFKYFIKIVNSLGNDWEAIVIGKGLSRFRHEFKFQVNFMEELSEEEMAIQYSRMNLLLIPSIIEGFCLPALEGAAMGCKIVHLGKVPTISEICNGTDFIVQEQLDDEHVKEWLFHIATSDIANHEEFINTLPDRYSWKYSASILKDQFNSVFM